MEGPDAPGRGRESGPEGAGAVTFERGDHQIRVKVGGEHFTTLHYSERWDKPFLHPIRTASGLTVSRGYPVDPAEGEVQDHDWHRGIWYGHGDINGHDFWRELGRGRTGTIVPVAEPILEEGEGRGAVEVLFGFRTAGGDTIGTVSQRYEFCRVGHAIRIDAVLRFAADREQDLRFGDTEDGGFAMRLARPFRQEFGAVLLNSEGERGTESIWGRAARWVDYSAVVDGTPAGVAILDHPSNLRHPTRWHARGYSLCSANPFGLRDFTGSAGEDGSHVVPSGEALTLHYRLVVHEGATKPETIERWFDEFASEPLG